MSRYANYVRKVQEHAMGGWGADLSKLAISDGNTKAPVMIVGWQHGESEAKPFTEPPRDLVRIALANMGVTYHMVLLTDLVKIPRPALARTNEDVGTWVDLLLEEIEIVEPKAVVLLGQEVAAWVLHGPSLNLASLRRARFIMPTKTNASFFATYAPADVCGRNLLSKSSGRYRPVEWVTDLRAVFEVDERHFRNTVTVR
jgi:uracil-DNA glycosylase family 4